MHEIEGVTVEDCRVSEGISQQPRLHSDSGIDLNHFPHLCAGFGQAAKARAGAGSQAGLRFRPEHARLVDALHQLCDVL
ncbi:MAG: hypothetical protein WB721_28010, partial [Pseudolabrys sp.]